MTPKAKLTTLLGTLLISATYSAGQEPELAFDKSQVATIPQLDFLRAAATQTAGMDIDGTPGDLSVSRLELRAILSEPIPLWTGMSMLPVFSYNLTSLDFSGTGPFPITDEDLHSASLHSFFIQNFQNSPWFALAWARAELATDFQGIQGDDVTFDVAAGLGYKFSDTFTLGFGFAVINLNGDAEIFPGINFDWLPVENVRVGLYGPNFMASYTINDSWYISLDGPPGGGNWNIDDNLGNSRTIQLDSYWLGINTHHRLTEKLWMSAGVGYTFGNEIEIRGNRGGSPSFSREMDGAALAQISLSLRTW